jgi:hypothetical protein
MSRVVVSLDWRVITPDENAENEPTSVLLPNATAPAPWTVKSPEVSVKAMAVEFAVTMVLPSGAAGLVPSYA